MITFDELETKLCHALNINRTYTKLNMVFRHPVPFPNGRAIVNYVYLPEDRNISGQRLRLTWLTENFPSLPLDVIVESMRCYDKAFILQLIGSFLFADKFNNKVHLMFLPLLEDLGVTGTYSWGSA